MQVLNRKEMEEAWKKLFKSLEMEFFKLEVLQDYTGEDDSPSLQEYKKGNREKGLELLKQEIPTWELWSTPDAPYKKIRVHIVTYPLTSYMEWELELYKLYNIPKIGEEICLVNFDDVKKNEIKLPEGDTLIFDNKIVMSHTYDIEKGLALTSKLYSASDEVASFLQLKEELLKIAKTL